jgi:plastocyanin
MIGVAGERGLNRLCRLVVVPLACVCGLLYAATGTQAADVHKPATHTIIIEGVKYVPEALTVKRGDTVVWINKDPFPHTVTAKGSFDSRDIGAGKSWRWTPRKAGEYAYICTLHPNMTAALKVE